MGRGFKTITFNFEDNGIGFITFSKEFDIVIDSLKDELEDSLDENDVIEIYSTDGERIMNQTQYNLYINNEALTELKIIVKKINKIEQERLEKERLEKERIEKERLEKERLEKERKEKERLEKERKEKERLEKERLKQLEKEKKEKEKLKKKANENTTKICDELKSKLSLLMEKKISKFYKKLEENKEQSNSMIQNLNNKIIEFENNNKNKNNLLNIKINKISNIINELKQEEKELIEQSNNTEVIESSLKKLKLNFSKNNQIQKQFNNFSNQFQQVIQKSMDDLKEDTNKQITNYSNFILNKNSDTMSEFNSIQAKINELKHYKKENNSQFLKTNSSGTNNNNYSDEQSFFPNTDIEYQIKNNTNVFKYSDIINNSKKIEVEIKCKKENYPKNCKIRPLKNASKEINFKEYTFDDEFQKNIPKVATLEFAVEKNKILSGKYNIQFGLFKPNLILIKKFNYEIEIIQ